MGSRIKLFGSDHTMKIRFQLHLLNLLLAAATFSLAMTTPGQAYAIQDRGSFGNGTILKRLFGNDRSDAEKKDKKKDNGAETLAKDLAEKEKKLAQRSREIFEATREQMQRDAERVQQKLKQSFGGSIGDNPNTDPSGSAAKTNPTLVNASNRNNVPIGQTGPGISSVLESTRQRNRLGNPDAVDVPQNPLSIGPKNQPRIRPETTPADGFSQTDPTSQTFGILADPNYKGKGIRVQKVTKNSLAQSIGIQPGDVLQSIAGLDLNEVADIDGISRVLQADDQFEIYFTRNGSSASKMMTFNGPVASTSASTAKDDAAIVDFPTTPEIQRSWAGTSNNVQTIGDNKSRVTVRNVSTANAAPAEQRVQQLEQSLRAQQEIIRRLEREIDQLKSKADNRQEMTPPNPNLQAPLPELELDLTPPK